MDIGEQEAAGRTIRYGTPRALTASPQAAGGYEPNGEASLYFNTAIGLVRRLYDYRKLELLFTALERQLREKCKASCSGWGWNGAPISGAGTPVRR